MSLIHRQLDGIQGIKSVRVSLIGRMAYVEHLCPVDEVLRPLKQAHLGAVLQTTGAEVAQVEHTSWHSWAFPSLLTLLWAVGLWLDQYVPGDPPALIDISADAVAPASPLSSLPAFVSRAIPVLVVTVGFIPVLFKALRSLSRCSLDINVLMSVAVLGSLVLGEWDDAGLVVLLLAWAKQIEEVSLRRVRNALSSSATTAAPIFAVLAANDEQIKVEKLKVGDIIAVRMGEQIPVDGDVIKGKITVDEGLLTGEATPVVKTKGARVLGGTLAINGYAEVKATSTFNGSTLSTIAHMVEEAGATATKTQQTLDTVLMYYVPAILLASFFIAFAVPFMSSNRHFKMWILRSLVVLISACPCALTVASVVPCLCGVACAADKGVLIKSCDKLEAMSTVSAIAFDKTGTLTEGKFKVHVSSLVENSGRSEEEIMHLVASLESKSSHPLASSIVSHVLVCVTDAVDTMGLDAGLSRVTEFKATEGRGISGVVQGLQLEIGNEHLLSSEELDKMLAFRSLHYGATMLYVRVEGQFVLALALTDTVRANAERTASQLHEHGVQTTILTGDSTAAMDRVLALTGIMHGKASCKPADKLSWVEASKKAGRVTAFIGDGINDSPALKAADIGLAMGAGSSAMAVNSADIAFLANELMHLHNIINLSRFVQRLVKLNIALAIVIKGVVVIMALFGYARLWMAVAADCGSLLLVLANSTRPLYYAMGNAKQPSGKRAPSVDQYDDLSEPLLRDSDHAREH